MTDTVKRTFKITAIKTVALTVDIDAPSIEEAQMLAETIDGGDFTKVPDSDDWYIYSVVEND